MFKKSLFLLSCTLYCFQATALTELKTVASFNQTIQNDMVVVDFFSPHCGPCKLLAPLLDQLALQLSNVQFFKININSADSLTGRYNIRGVPCLIFFKNGIEVGRHVGCSPKTTVADLNKEIKAAFGI